MEAAKLTHAQINAFHEPSRHMDELIAIVSGYKVVEHINNSTSLFIYDGRTVRSVSYGSREDALFNYAPKFTSSNDEAGKLVAGCYWSAEHKGDSVIVNVSEKKKGMPSVVTGGPTLAFSLCAAWLHLQVPNSELSGATMESAINQEKLELAEQIIKRAMVAELTRDLIGLSVPGALSVTEMLALDYYAASRGQYWAKTVINKALDTTVVRYERPAIKLDFKSLTGI